MYRVCTRFKDDEIEQPPGWRADAWIMEVASGFCTSGVHATVHIRSDLCANGAAAKLLQRRGNSALELFPSLR